MDAQLLNPDSEDPTYLLRMSPLLVVGIILVVVTMALAVFLVDRARRLAVHDDNSPHNELDQFELMREAGEISEEEYRRMKKIIADKLVQRVKGD